MSLVPLALVRRERHLIFRPGRRSHRRRCGVIISTGRGRRIVRLAVWAAVWAIAALSAYARHFQEKPLPRVRAYVDNGAIPPSVLHLAEGIADGMFATAGVRIEWQGHSPEGSRLPGGALAIGLDTHAPANFLPRALAFTRVYEGVHIEVFCDRLERLAPGAK